MALYIKELARDPADLNTIKIESQYDIADPRKPRTRTVYYQYDGSSRESAWERGWTSNHFELVKFGYRQEEL